MNYILFFLTIVMIQRLVELKIANRNAKWIKGQGGYEVGREHYKYIVGIHLLFFISLLTEIYVMKLSLSLWSLVPLFVFLLAQIGRVWALASLGKYWNTRIMILPGAKVVAKGPYRYMKHPNYVIVATEIVALPLMFQAYLTAIIFTFLNAIILTVRVRAEEEALEALTNYKEAFSGRNRFFPRYED
ncbi:isoprenylcysteine carboxyl methyltransferase family protein [Halalkalibacter urbisdiaboli]|uniref:isoprenylcysteine carboxyl methyltransferase family protein n=1 Tax=Halalkalibacter urbisdiaboli TaxID=1960589 RepID=UPI001A99BCB2|nr:isoprenylcysteine carboxyl methyltransferase family protein [Halalkalibacter urbisdiaboli]